MRDEYLKLTPEQAAEAERVGLTTAWQIQCEYGISKLMVSRYIRNKKLNGIMCECVCDKGKEYQVIKWYIFKDEKYKRFIEEHRKI